MPVFRNIPSAKQTGENGLLGIEWCQPAGPFAFRIGRLAGSQTANHSESRSSSTTAFSCPSSPDHRPSIGHRNGTDSIPWQPQSASLVCSFPRFNRSKSLKHGYLRALQKRYRGFESHSLRHSLIEWGLTFNYCTVPRGLTPSSGAQVEHNKASENCLIAAIASGDAVLM
jgi:hypothetical protein